MQFFLAAPEYPFNYPNQVSANLGSGWSLVNEASSLSIVESHQIRRGIWCCKC